MPGDTSDHYALQFHVCPVEEPHCPEWLCRGAGAAALFEIVTTPTLTPQRAYELLKTIAEWTDSCGPSVTISMNRRTISLGRCGDFGLVRLPRCLHAPAVRLHRLTIIIYIMNIFYNI